MRSFGRSMYAISCFYGSVPWLENANNLPEIIRHLNENMIAAAYVVHSPQEYWNQKRELIMTMHEDWDEAKIQKEMERLKDELTEAIADVMAGKKNAGKFFSCVDFMDDLGHTQSWKIEPIEMNIDKYIEAQAKISRIADSSTTSGFGLSLHWLISLLTVRVTAEARCCMPSRYSTVRIHRYRKKLHWRLSMMPYG